MRLSIAIVLTGVDLCNAGAAGHWAFQPIVSPPLPTLGRQSDPKRNPVDLFILAKLAEHNLPLTPEADRRTLIRRLSFDLRGLPPTPEEIAQFLADDRADAYEDLVARFLASPLYGERWGRHWLDIVAYADSNGYFSADSDRPLAWRFRDYIVRSFNADKPFARFIQEQIAGDELVGHVPGGDVTPEMVDPLIATHFWRNPPDGSGESDGNPLEVKVDRYSVIEGNVQLLGSAFLGLTLQCARCHDHKFEPVKQEEFYALQAVLRPALDPDRWLKPNERLVAIGTRAAREKHERSLREHERALKTWKESLEGLTAPFRKQILEENLATLDEPLRKALQQALDTREKDRNAAMKALVKTNAGLVEITESTLTTRFPAFALAAQPLRDAIRERESSGPKPLEKIAALTEPTNRPPVHHLFVRGNHAQEGKEVAPGVPAILSANCGFDTTPSTLALLRQKDAPQNEGEAVSTDAPPKLATSGRRLALAHWLTSPENPIVARSLVNRVWFYHFGQGLVATPDNLGQAGARPTHPELLDWLAAEFIRSGWSLKNLHRFIVTSATYRQSAGFPMLRLDAESIRDAMLAVSGEIDLTPGGPYVPIKIDPEGQVIIDEQHPGARRRSLYLQQRRTQPVNLLAAFDGPAHNPVCIQRVQSTVALQSLSLLNSDCVRTRARAFARRVLRSANLGTANEQAAKLNSAVQSAFELAWARRPNADELVVAQSFLSTQAAHYIGMPDATEHVWTDFCQMLLASNQFLYVE